ncbi:MAG: ABC transporter ATP-binding protein, partial [Paracoccaceae bacterium]
EPLRRLSNVSGQLQLLNASLDRLHYVYKVSPKISNTIDQKINRLSKSKSYLEFKNVSLNYGEENILSGISMKIEKGQSVALVGASGSGKSTMLNLISRLIEPTSGEIFLEGRKLRDVPVGDLRSTISVVSQENNLFDDSIHRNIVLERKVENNELFLDILNKAAVSDFVNNLDEGLDFQVGPRGLNLSGGQRQRIAIARALFRDSELMLLDEPTSALDSETENRVQNNTKKFLDKKTVITTTHKLEIAKYADKILVFQEGKIVAQGRHVDLIKKQGPYLNLWVSQKENNKSLVGRQI